MYHFTGLGNHRTKLSRSSAETVTIPNTKYKADPGNSIRLRSGSLHIRVGRDVCYLRGLFRNWGFGSSRFDRRIINGWFVAGREDFCRILRREIFRDQSPINYLISFGKGELKVCVLVDFFVLVAPHDEDYTI
jgi:hypothetical protein